MCAQLQSMWMAHESMYIKVLVNLIYVFIHL